MNKLTIYQYEGTYLDAKGETKKATYVTPVKIAGAYSREERVRLEASEGMMLSKDGGSTLVKVIDTTTDDAELWQEYPEVVED